MRCARLAQVWMKAGWGQACIQGEVTIPFVRERVRGLGIPSSAEPSSAEVLVVDCYDPAERERLARGNGALLRVLVDDLGEPCPAGYDVVWNPNACGSATLYPAFKGPVLTGARAVPLEEDGPTWRGGAQPRVAVVLGGGDTRTALAQAAVSLPRVAPQYRFAGAGAWVPPHWERIDQARFWQDIASCGCLVTASGRTVWEAAAVGIPVVALVVAENQRRIGAWVREAGAPCIEATGRDDSPALTQEILGAIPLARSLPRLSDGSADVATRLATLALERRAA
jgi:hypothetical protein